MRSFEYETFVSFEETNVVGNVYFSNYFVWQGKCREAFLRQHAPQVLKDFAAGFGMITKDSSCTFHKEAFAFQQIEIQMSLSRLSRTEISMSFDYFRKNESGDRELLAQGSQSVIWMSPSRHIAVLPPYLYEAVKGFVVES